MLTLASQAGAVVLISDNFDNLALNANLQTRTPYGVSFVNNVNTTGFRYIGLAMANNLPDTGAVQTVDNFLFEGPVPIPEPAAAGLSMLRRRR